MTNAAIYRTKMLQVEAIKWDGSVAASDAIEKWSNGVVSLSAMLSKPAKPFLSIATTEGVATAAPGDYIVRSGGRYWPMKADAFDAKYERDQA